MGRAKDHRAKVDGFLEQALAARDDVERAALLGKAVYWNQCAMRDARTSEGRLHNPWGCRHGLRSQA